MKDLINILVEGEIMKDRLREVFEGSYDEIINCIKNNFQNKSYINKKRFINIVTRFWEIKKFLKDRFSGIVFLSCIFALEGFMCIFEGNVDKNKFKEYMKKYLESDDKKKLILAFTFGDEHKNEHLCFNEVKEWAIKHGLVNNGCEPTDISRDDNFEPSCECKAFLNNISEDKLNQYFDELLDRWYEMRNSEVHRGFPLSLEFKKENNQKEPENSTGGSYLDRNNNEIVVEAVNINIIEPFIKVIKNKLKENQYKLG